MRDATAAILRRDPQAWRVLPDVLRKVDAGSARPLFEGLEVAPDARSLTVLFDVARSRRELAAECVGSAARCGAKVQGTADLEFVSWMRSELSSAPPAYARRLVDAIGALDDGGSAAVLIDRLGDEDPGVRQSAWQGLKRSTGLAFPADAAAWRRWLKTEDAWQDRERPQLRSDLSSPNVQRVVPALHAYGDHKTRRSELALEVAVVLESTRPELRRLACEVLATLKSRAACAALVRHLHDPDGSVAESAWQTLRTITGLEVPRDPESARASLALP